MDSCIFLDNYHIPSLINQKVNYLCYNCNGDNMKELIIVEGKSDTRRLKEINSQIQTFETSGLGLDDEKLNQLQKFKENGYQLICFTDPDYPGEKIRKKINDTIPGVLNAYVPREQSISKRGKVGIESATTESILNALANIYEFSTDNLETPVYDMSFLLDNHLYGDRSKRLEFCTLLNIAYGNNQKILKQLNNFSIPKTDVEKVLRQMEQNAKSE